MKLLKGALAAALMLSATIVPVSSAFAQASTPAPAASAATSRCGDLPADPTLPDGASANSQAIQAGDAAYQAWAEAVRTVVTCRRAEYEELLTIATARRDQHNQMAAKLNSLTAAWVVERDEYCARPRSRCEPATPPAQ